MEINKVYASDVIEFIKEMPDNFIDKVITSPPYNINRRYNNYRDNISADKFIEWQVEMFKELERTIKPNGLILYNFSYGAEDPLLPYSLIHNIDNKTDWTIVETIVWKKPNATAINTNRLTRIVEYIYVFSRKSEVKTFERNKAYNQNGELNYKYKRNFIEAPNNDGIDVPLNKAVYSTEMILKLMDIYVKHEDIVCDVFNGLGTTVRSCLIYGCNYIACDLDKDQVNYFNNKRLRAIIRKLPKLRKYYSQLNIEFRANTVYETNKNRKQHGTKTKT